MNLSYLKYAVEVEKTGSITKAAQNFYMNQPHLSKIIKELEKDLGSPIFNRTGRGVIPTKKGEEFLRCAKSILTQVEDIEALCGQGEREMLTLSISVPRASYISSAFTEFLKASKEHSSLSVTYQETNLLETIRHVTDKIHPLGIIRYQTISETYYQKMMKEENLEYENLWEFSLKLVVSDQSPLIRTEHLSYLHLKDFIEITYGDLNLPSFNYESRDTLRTNDCQSRTVSVYDRGSQLELLRQIPNTYMWSSPTPEKALSAMSLVERECSQPGNRYKDVLIYRNGYHLTAVDNLFLQCLHQIIAQLSDL